VVEASGSHFDPVSCAFPVQWLHAFNSKVR
jgi:hypothetical protein